MSHTTCLADAPIAAPRPPEDQASRLRALVGVAARPRVEQAAPPLTVPTFPAPAPRAVPRTGARVVTVASGKGGVGKTTLCVNMCIALAALGHRATLVDADLGMANADLMCGLAPTRRLERVIGLSESGAPDLLGPARMSELAVEAPGGFRLIPGSVGIAKMADLSSAERARLIEGLGAIEADADVIVVDAAAGVGSGVLSLVAAADLCIVVATPEPTSITDAYALVKCALAAAEDRAAPALCLVVNQAATEAEAMNVHARIANTCSRFLSHNLPLLGWIAQDVRVGAAIRRRRPLLLDHPKCQAGRDLRSVSAALAGRLSLGDPRAGRADPSGRLGRVLSRFVRRDPPAPAKGAAFADRRDYLPEFSK